jgi:hypothetical protein
VRESKRARIPASQFQSPNPELVQIMRSLKKTEEAEAEAKAAKAEDNPAIFFKAEHLAVRNAEGSFFLCKSSQNIYKNSRKIKIQWLGISPEDNPDKDIYVPEYYDTTGIFKILTKYLSNFFFRKIQKKIIFLELFLKNLKSLYHKI